MTESVVDQGLPPKGDKKARIKQVLNCVKTNK